MPEELKIGGHIWKVKLEKLSEDDLGSTDWNTKTILISNELPEDMQHSALLHEILHACNSTWGSTEMGHALLDSIAEQLYQVISDNKLVIQ
jgi:hypothetical protein